MIALVVGTALAVAGLLYVLFPLFDSATRPGGRASGRSADGTPSSIEALREIEFDRATGKLSDEDYASLKATYTRAALVELRAREGVSESQPPTLEVGRGASGEVLAIDAAEAAVLRYRAIRRDCPSCGPRPEPDPAFCSSCGQYLKGRCTHCGAVVDAPAARFCPSCGESLAA